MGRWGHPATHQCKLYKAETVLIPKESMCRVRGDQGVPDNSWPTYKTRLIKRPFLPYRDPSLLQIPRTEGVAPEGRVHLDCSSLPCYTGQNRMQDFREKEKKEGGGGV